METNSQTATEGRSPAFTVRLNKDGDRRVVRQGAGDDGPVPIDDAELEAVAGGSQQEWDFTWAGCGCETTVTANNAMEAYEQAEAWHYQMQQDGYCQE